jgi:hypothetical protein
LFQQLLHSQPILTLASDDNSTTMEISNVHHDIPKFIIIGTQAIPTTSTSQQITISPPLTLTSNLVLKEVCKIIFDSLEELMESRNQAIHLVNYADNWENLR